MQRDRKDEGTEVLEVVSAVGVYTDDVRGLCCDVFIPTLRGRGRGARDIDDIRTVSNPKRISTSSLTNASVHEYEGSGYEQCHV